MYNKSHLRIQSINNFDDRHGLSTKKKKKKRDIDLQVFKDSNMLFRNGYRFWDFWRTLRGFGTFELFFSNLIILRYILEPNDKELDG